MLRLSMFMFLLIASACQKQGQESNDNGPQNGNGLNNASLDGGAAVDNRTDPSQPQKFQGETKNGNKQGPWIYWYDNGTKAAAGEYADGQKQGAWSYWYDNGQKAAEGQYKNGKKDGPWTQWDEQGKKISERQFREGAEIFK